MNTSYQLDLFSASMPNYLACSDDFNNVIRLPKEKALTKSYIAPNNSSFINCLLFDIDKPDAGASWIDNNILMPNWICQNPSNGHAHYGYMLKKPVSRTLKARGTPQRYLARIQQAMTERLEADAGYAHFLTKTPSHEKHRTIWGRNEPFTLDELRDGLDADLPLRLKRETAVGEGRNVTLFDGLRFWAYRERLKYDNFDKWFEACFKHAQMLNQFNCPLSYNEIKSTAKSVAKWTWKNLSQSGLSERGRRNAKKRWRKHETKTMDILASMLEFSK